MNCLKTTVKRCPRSVPRSRAAAVNSIAWRALTIALGVLLCCTVAPAQMTRYNGVRVNLWPSPRVAPADGKTSSTIRAELRDAGGQPVADGTTVIFRIEGGQLSLDGNERRQVVTTETSGGAATVYATSSTTGTATVFAEVTTGQGKNQVSIAFVAEGSSLLGGSGVVHVRGNWVGYALDLAVIEARDQAEVVFSGVTVNSPDVLQIDVNSLTLKAMNAEVEVDGRTLSADDLSYDLMSGQGVIRRVGDAGVERMCFDCFTLEEREPDRRIAGESFRLDTANAAVWAVADGISVFPHEKVVLRGATLYAGGERVVELPRYWVIAMPGYTGTTHSRVLGMNSSGELAVDFPYFYRVGETRTGAVKVQHGATSGSVIARDDWSLALEEAYDDGRAEGSISLVGLPQEDWGLEWRDQRSLGPHRDAHITLYSPDHESYYGDANIYQWHGNRRLNLSTSLRKPAGQDFSYAVSADWLTMNRPLGIWDASYRLGTAVGARHIAEVDDGVVGENNLYAAIDLPREYLGERTSLRPSISNLFAWDTSGYSHNSARGELRLRHIVSSDKSMHFSYQGQLTSGDNADGYEHLVNFDLRAYHGRAIASYLTTTYDISDDEFYGFGLFDYYLNDRWTLGLAGTYYDVADDVYDDIEVTVTRKLGPTEVGLRWSEESRRISLELGDFSGLGFR